MASRARTRKHPAKRAKPDGLRRYTILASAIHMLRTKRITLLDPGTWDDKNDAYFMSEYKRLASLKTLLALCFAQSDQTYHHWRVFTRGGADGVCIDLDKDRLIETFAADPFVSMRRVEYKRIETLKARRTIAKEDLPFLKRLPYKDEREFRVVYANPREALEGRDFPIEIEWIKRITLSPWMPAALRNSVSETLREIPGCSKLKIYRSTMVGNRDWMALTKRAV